MIAKIENSTEKTATFEFTRDQYWATIIINDNGKMYKIQDTLDGIKIHAQTIIAFCDGANKENEETKENEEIKQDIDNKKKSWWCRLFSGNG